MARDGIGNGDILVAGLDNIRSFAPIENAPFAASHDPTLYDVFDDSYNENFFSKKGYIKDKKRKVKSKGKDKVAAESNEPFQGIIMENWIYNANFLLIIE